MICFDSFLNAEREDPLEPCSHWAGTPGKIEAMRLRWAAGEAIHHPDDCKRKLKRFVDTWNQRLTEGGVDKRHGRD